MDFASAMPIIVLSGYPGLPVERVASSSSTSCATSGESRMSDRFSATDRRATFGVVMEAATP
jgi:hypothetical protein